MTKYTHCPIVVYNSDKAFEIALRRANRSRRSMLFLHFSAAADCENMTVVALYGEEIGAATKFILAKSIEF